MGQSTLQWSFFFGTIQSSLLVCALWTCIWIKFAAFLPVFFRIVIQNNPPRHADDVILNRSFRVLYPDGSTYTWGIRWIQCAAVLEWISMIFHCIPSGSLKDCVQAEIWRETTRRRKRRFIGKIAWCRSGVLLPFPVHGCTYTCTMYGEWVFDTFPDLSPPPLENRSLRLLWFVFSMYFTGIRLVIRCTGQVTAVFACKRVSVSVCTSASPD